MKWSVLDQSPASAGRLEEAAIRDSLVLAQDCDALGYERFWVSEHHNAASIVGTAPEVLAAAIAATTRRIRVGSAGVMLPQFPEGYPYRHIVAHPTGPTSPQLWILGSSGYGAQLAAHFGLPYAFAYFFSDGAGVDEALGLYRRYYRPSERYPKPCATICVWALAAETAREAQRHSYALLARAFGLHCAAPAP